MKKAKKTKANTATTRDTDASLKILDAALTAAEDQLQKLLPAFPPRQIACLFSEHVMTHATEELSNIAKHGHRNDDPADIPQNDAHQELLEAAANLLSAKDRTNQSLRDALRRAVLKAGGTVYSKS